MKTIYDIERKSELLGRVEKLSAGSKPLWGKMDAAQMLTHCTRTLQAPTGDFHVKRSPIRFIGRFFKNGYIYTDKEFSKNSPTAPEFRTADPRTFAAEKEDFLAAFQKLAAGEHSVKVFENSFFGKMTPAEWGILMYKHLDHHLRQFGL